MATVLFSRSSGDYYWNSSTSTAFNFIYGDYSTSLTVDIPSNQQTNSVTLQFSNPDAKISTSSGLSKTIDCYFYFNGSYITYKSIKLSSISSSWTAKTIYSYSISLGGNYSNGTLEVELSSNYSYGDSDRLCVTTHGSSTSYGSYATTSTASVTSYISYYNGSSLHDSTSKTGTSGSKFTYYLASAPSKTGYTFKGWGTSSSASTTYSAGASRTGYYGTDYTWYANWTIDTYKISYNANGGSGAPNPQTKTYNVALTLSSDKPTREGHEFLGWATSSNATSATYSAGGSYTTNAAVTLYAVWQAKEYSVLYNGNGGVHSTTGEEIWEDTVNKFKFGKEYDISLKTLGDKGFKYPGYNLLGWNTSWTAIEPLEKIKIEEDKQPELYAIWELGSNIRVYTNENWQIAIPYIYENGEWKLSISKVFNNEEWRQ